MGPCPFLSCPERTQLFTLFLLSEQQMGNKVIFTHDLITYFLYNYRFLNIYSSFVKCMNFILQLYEKVALLLTNLGK